MNKRSLAVTLSKLDVFAEPDAQLEQHPTDSEVAALLLHNADMIDGLTGKRVLDLGAGTGILAAGALLCDAASAILLDIDKKALQIAERNLASLNVEDKAAFLHAPLGAQQADIVVMNPPFGIQNRHVDRAFLDAAFASAPIVYSIHDAPSKPWVGKYAQEHGYTLTHAWETTFLLKQTMPHHTDKRKRIPVVCVRLTKQ